MQPVAPAVAAGLPLAGILRGHVPAQVPETQATPTADTPENRFVLAFLDWALGLIAALRADLTAPDQVPNAFITRTLADCTRLEQALRPVRRAGLWQGVGPLGAFPAGSPVLQQRRGYRPVFAAFARLRLAARVPLPETRVLDWLQGRDLAHLYELWCYFTVVATLAGLLGPPVAAGQPAVRVQGLHMPWALTVRWADGTTVAYNVPFARSHPAARRSSSLPLRPDILLTVPGGPGAGLHVFDAKFRVTRAGPLLDGSADGEAAIPPGSFQRADVYKMHTYRDALVGVRSAWVLYPGRRRGFSQRGLGRCAMGWGAAAGAGCRGAGGVAGVVGAGVRIVNYGVLI